MTFTTKPNFLYSSMICAGENTSSEAKRLSSPSIKASEVLPLNSSIEEKVTELIHVLPVLVFGSPDFLPS